ncbi:EpsG family protein [Lederbergia sp. NSJ-179]|uniref:EpsG family protein n=1 Tax=Lederbergia sp. NSJ-179 TaxID=2931402 RepID=UPI001FCFD37A|nr:EpsG family protein [Lederbergia sp. NSJ-179]MCJ7840500.1 EpsG family protein [Lederbergia sp. NSJ-179]
METYLLVAIVLIILGLSFEAVNSITKQRIQKKLPTYFYIVPSFLLLFIISAFRGNFTTDYNNYTFLFRKINSFGFFDAFIYGPEREFGYVLLNRTIGLFTSNEIFLFAITTFIILFGFYHQFKKYSVNIWLSVLMLVTAGSYYASFNITRQILAASIIFIGSKFLYERKFFKYLLVVLLAFLFHKTALIMIPFYFILNFRINIRNLLLFFISSTILVFYFDGVIDFVQNFAYDNYTENSYGMTGQNVANVVLPIAFLIFSLFHVKKLDPKNNMHRIWFNAVVFYAIFNILALQVEMVERLSRFFASYALLLIPFLFSKMQNKNLRVIYMMVLIFVLILYNFVILSDSVFDPYYFIWDK